MDEVQKPGNSELNTVYIILRILRYAIEIANSK
jgi:hypothetical protein